MLKVTTFDTVADTNQTHLYSDLHLDMAVDITTRGAPYSSNRNAKNIAIDYDIDAIRNSLFNLFTTRPGQRPLDPRYGLNLSQFLAEPATDTTALLIGELILRGITRYEPRVQVVNINVEPFEEQGAFEITLTLVILGVGNQEAIHIFSKLDQTGFNFTS